MIQLLGWAKALKLLQVFAIFSLNIIFGLIIVELLLELGFRKYIKQIAKWIAT